MEPDNSVAYDDWMEGWSEVIRSSAGSALDVGCGPGFDSEALRSWNFDVTATDLSPDALARSQARNPTVRHVLADARTLEGLGDGTYGIVVASLSLHYFSRDESHRAFQSVSRVLREESLFVFRVNAWDDFHFGAQSGVPAWETVSYKHVTKQFFTRERVQELLADRFDVLSLVKRATLRYGKEKSYLAVLCRKKRLQA